MFGTLADLVPRDNDLPERAWKLETLRRVLDGTIYDVLTNEFHQERQDGGLQEYIPLRSRKPSVRYNLCRLVVDDSVSLLFSEGHFPAPQCEHKSTKEGIEALIKEARIDTAMVDAAVRGAVGSIVLLLRVLNGRVFVDVMDTIYLTPTWQAEAPDTLERVTERYKVKGSKLREAGYAIADDDLAADFWFEREWDAAGETWYTPRKVADIQAVRSIDTQRSVTHKLGLVPIVWVRNLPGPSATGSPHDGACTFRAAIETAIEIDYQLSQAGRGLKYSSDPTLLIKEPAASEGGQMIKGGENAIIVSEKGDAKLLEIGGTASAAVIEYVRCLREFAIEAMHGNRANADKMSAAQSGRALELMNQGLIWLADRLRASYGEGALLSLLKMIVVASSKYDLTAAGKPIKLDASQQLTLKWPRWYAPTAEDRQADAGTITTLIKGGVMSRETGVATLADDYDIEDVPAELARIASDQAAEDARLAKQAAQTKATEAVPS